MIVWSLFPQGLLVTCLSVSLSISKVTLFSESIDQELFNNKLVILSASAINIKNVTKDFLQNLNEESQNKLQQKEISDYDRYMLNHKIDTIKEITI